ncbi:MAG: TIGR02300 family protein [Caulobacterales bacterium]
MPKINVGEKQTCPQCGSKFYDLTRRPAVCPKCAFAFDPGDEAFRARRAKARTGGFDPAAEEEEEAVEAEEAVAVADDEDAEPEAELEEVVDDAPEGTLIEEDDDAVVTSDDDLGDGFSEADVEVEDAEDDDTVPFLEDDDAFEEEIGDIGGDDDDN